MSRAQLARIDALIGRLEGQLATLREQRALLVVRGRPRSETTRAILFTLGKRPTSALTVGELLERMVDDGWSATLKAPDTTVRQALRRLAEHGEVHRIPAAGNRVRWSLTPAIPEQRRVCPRVRPGTPALLVRELFERSDGSWLPLGRIAKALSTTAPSMFPPGKRARTAVQRILETIVAAEEDLVERGPHGMWRKRPVRQLLPETEPALG